MTEAERLDALEARVNALYRWHRFSCVLMAFVIFLLLGSLAFGGHPSADAASIAWQDSQKIQPIYQQQVRYCFSVNASEAQRIEEAQALNLLVNTVSRNGVIKRCEPVDQGYRVLRLHLASYKDPRKPGSYFEIRDVWESLGAIHPYTTIRTTVADGRGGATIKSVAGGWMIDTPSKLAAWNGLCAATQSDAPLLRTDFLIGRLSKPPFYYDWAGIPKTQAEFLFHFGVVVHEEEANAGDLLANMVRSDITEKPRRVARYQGRHGGVWGTFDVNKETAERNPIRNPVDFKEQKFIHDASEWFAMGPNRLWRTAIFNGQGKRVDFVPQEIVPGDTTSTLAFALSQSFSSAPIEPIVPHIGCIRCHEMNGGVGGLQPFSDIQSLLPVAGATPDFIRQRIGEAYRPEWLATGISRDAIDYAQAVRQCCAGMDTLEAAKVLAAVYAEYTYQPVTREMAAREVGVTPQQLTVALSTIPDDSLLIVLGRGGVINRADWELSYFRASGAVSGMHKN